MNENESLPKSIIAATKWSSITEIAVKIVTPFTSMILARILTPVEFGVVAAIMMVISFAEMFTDAGFQKYLIQHEFYSEEEKHQSANVAFWTNFFISIFLWSLIYIFRDQIAIVVGSEGLGNVIAVASLQLPLAAFSSIQTALYKRSFDFKTLFIARLVAICIPFIVTIPLALIGFSYWSLIIGTLAIQLSNAIILTIKSTWKPKIKYSFKLLQEMFSFSVWTLIESISIWLTGWLDVFLISSSLTSYYLGLYKTSTSLVNALFSIITASVIPVLFSALSRVQHDQEKFQSLFFSAQQAVSIFVLPLGVGIYLYRNIAMRIMLGNQWSEAADIIGLWAIMSALIIVFSNFNSEVYRAKGRPKLSFLSQILHLIVLAPACIISLEHGFWTFVYVRSLVRIELIIVGLILIHFVIGISAKKIIINILPPMIASIAMGVFGYFLKQLNSSISWDIFSIILCALFYFLILSLFPKMRKTLVKGFAALKKIKA